MRRNEIYTLSRIIGRMHPDVAYGVAKHFMVGGVRLGYENVVYPLRELECCLVPNPRGPVVLYRVVSNALNRSNFA